MIEDLVLPEHISHFFYLLPQLCLDFLFLHVLFFSGIEFCPLDLQLL